MGATCKKGGEKDVVGQTEAIQEERRKRAEAAALKAAQDEQALQEEEMRKQAEVITLVLLELNGNPGSTFQLNRNLQQLELRDLQEYIYGLRSLVSCSFNSSGASLPESWRVMGDSTFLRESDLALSIGDAAITGGMSLHQNGRCCLPHGCNPLSLCFCNQS